MQTLFLYMSCLLLQRKEKLERCVKVIAIVLENLADIILNLSTEKECYKYTKGCKVWLQICNLKRSASLTDNSTEAVVFTEV